MTRISIDKPCYFITSVTHDRLPIFRTSKLKQIVCNALHEARKSADLLYFGYAIMPDHFPIVTDGKRPPSDTVRYLNGVTEKRVLDYLKENEFTSSLLKLRETVKERGYKHSVWEHHSDKFLLTIEDTFRQKIEYITTIRSRMDWSSGLRIIFIRVFAFGMVSRWMMSLWLWI